MVRAEKFLFETCFDFEQDLPREPGDDGARYVAEDLARAEQDGIAAGRAAALAEAQRSSEEAAAQALAAIAEQLQDLDGRLPDLAAACERDTLAIAVTALRVLFPELAKRSALDEVEGLIRDCLQNLGNEPRVVVRTPDALHDVLRTRLEGLCAEVGFEGRVVLLTEEDLGPGDARIEWADGGAERNTSELWSKVEAVLMRGLEDPNPPARRQATEIIAPAAEPAKPESATLEPAPHPDPAKTTATSEDVAPLEDDIAVGTSEPRHASDHGASG